MSKLRETHPEMAYQIDQTIMNVGLRLPTPSPSQSPANSARSISSRTSSIRSSASSKSNLPIGSARTQRSDIQAQPIKQGNVQKKLIFDILATFDKKSQNLPYRNLSFCIICF